MVYTEDVQKEFQQAVEELVRKCNGNQSEAARRAGVSTALISDTLAGNGPNDPKTATLTKIQQALGRPLHYTMRPAAPSTVREDNGALADKLITLSVWIRANPDAWPFVLNAARGCGYKESS